MTQIQRSTPTPSVLVIAGLSMLYLTSRCHQKTPSTSVIVCSQIQDPIGLFLILPTSQQHIAADELCRLRNLVFHWSCGNCPFWETQIFSLDGHQGEPEKCFSKIDQAEPTKHQPRDQFEEIQKNFWFRSSLKGKLGNFFFICSKFLSAQN